MSVDKFFILVKNNNTTSKVYLNSIQIIILLLIQKYNKNYLADFIKKLNDKNLTLTSSSRLQEHITNLVKYDILKCYKGIKKRKEFTINKDVVVESSLDIYNIDEIIEFTTEHMFNKSFILKHKENSTKDLKLNFKQAYVLYRIYNYKTIKQSNLYHILKDLGLFKTYSSLRHYLKFLENNKLIYVKRTTGVIENVISFLEDEIDYIIDEKFINLSINLENFLFNKDSETKCEIKVKDITKVTLSVSKNELLILSILKNNSSKNYYELYKNMLLTKNISYSYVKRLVKNLIKLNLVSIRRKYSKDHFFLSAMVIKESLPDKVCFSQ